MRDGWLTRGWGALLLALVAGACGGGETAVGEGAVGGPADRTGASSAEALPAVDVSVENVLLVTLDTLRADRLGFLGDERAETPVLDRLAAEGRVYPRAHAHNVVTLPSHANILTGLYPYRHGVRDNRGFRLPDGIPTLATELRDAGFATGAVIGAFPLASRFGLARGFDFYDEELPLGSHPAEIVPAERPGSEVVRRGLEWWRAHDGQRRLLWLHLFDPHAPYEPPEPFATRFAADPYRGEVAATDAHLAPLLTPFLEGREAPTLIAVTSDHGEALGDHGELTHGLFAYEPTLRVPLVLWARGLPAGSDPRPARHVDLLPTLLRAVGLQPPEGLSGRSLLGPPEPDAATYFEALTATLDRGWAPLRGTLAGSHKLIALPLPELYDLGADPAETRNLVDRERQRARRLAARLPEESSWPPERLPSSPEERRALQSLGYLGGDAPARAEFTAADDPKRLVHLDRKMHRVIDLYQRGRLDEAARTTREVLAERPEMRIAHYYLAQVLLQRGDLAGALEAMFAARARNAASPALLRQLGLSLAEAGRAAEAVEVLEPLAGEDDPQLLQTLGVVYSEAGRQADARRVLERAAALAPSDPVIHESLALVALRREEWTAARAAARRALDLNPELPLAWNYLGTALYNLGEKRDALAALRKAAGRDPRDFDVLYNAAVVAMELGELEAARGALRRFVAEAPPGRYAADIERARIWLRRLGG
ncbi:MAG: sulfatase-like hydrolase/transferase [Thermoanaerobaculia bacterium]|nr:sulfatase-like hydrolase/transferase [Thermoanaerobaculia bacterium]